MLFTGANSLAAVRCFIGENYDWLLSQLGIAALLSYNDDSSVTAPALSLDQQLQQQQSQYTCKPSEDFNPLSVFTCIGRSPFNHVRMTNSVGVFSLLVIFTVHRAIVQFSASGRTILLLSGEVKFADDHP